MSDPVEDAIQDAITEATIYEEIRASWPHIDAQARVTNELLLKGRTEDAITSARSYAAMCAHQTELEELAAMLAAKREGTR